MLSSRIIIDADGKIYEGKTEKDSSGSLVFDTNVLNDMMNKGCIDFLSRAWAWTNAGSRSSQDVLRSDEALRRRFADVLESFYSNMMLRINESRENSNILFSSSSYSLGFWNPAYENEDKTQATWHVTTVFKVEVTAEKYTISASIARISTKYTKLELSPSVKISKMFNHRRKGLDHDSLSHFQNCKIPPLSSATTNLGTLMHHSIRSADWCPADWFPLMKQTSTGGGIEENCTTHGKKSKKPTKSVFNYFKMRHLKFKESFLRHCRKYMNLVMPTKNWLNKYCLSLLTFIHASVKKGLTKLLDGLLCCWFSYAPNCENDLKKGLKS